MTSETETSVSPNTAPSVTLAEGATSLSAVLVADSASHTEEGFFLTGAQQSSIPQKSSRRRSLAKKLPLLTTLPFFLYVGIFLVTPACIVVWGAFSARDGSFTFDNLLKLTNPNTVSALFTSIGVSAASASIGAVVGSVCAYLLVTLHGDGLGKRLMLALSSVLAQFGGVMLAFAFIATIGINGIGTQLLAAAFGYQIDPNWISSLPGLVVIYSYFQIPLMIIVFVPAVGAIRPQWREATANLGGSNWTYWSKVAGPILWPRFLGAFLLLFANAFSAYATAAALFAQRSILIPLMIQGALRNEQDPGQNGVAQALAMLMVIVVAVVMGLYSWIQKRTAKWEQK
ncbi:ABC transporter permease subunit [Actinomycetaceae bacterium TAE3-ERU4]|nr:ABC transporter permease subunit [Actinomycetaceae bacterium TAE3-ERU4]